MILPKLLVGISGAILSLMLSSCEQVGEEEHSNFLERGIYRSNATGDEILIGDVDAVITFKGKKLVVVAFEDRDDGALEFSPIAGREDSFNSSSASRSTWTWEPRTIRQHTGGITLQQFSLLTQ